MFRRKRLPAELAKAFERFEAVCEAVERAMGMLTEGVPSTRLPGRPLAEVLAGFEDGLREAQAGMPEWRRPEVEAVWRACEQAIRDGLAMAERLRLEAPEPEGFGALIGTIGALLGPLEDSFETATERFRALRT